MRGPGCILTAKSLEDCIFTLKYGNIELSSMFEGYKNGKPLFSIPAYEDNGNLFYPGDTGSDEYDYLENVHLTVANEQVFFDLLLGNPVRVEIIGNRYSQINKLKSELRKIKLQLI